MWDIKPYFEVAGEYHLRSDRGSRAFLVFTVQSGPSALSTKLLKTDQVKCLRDALTLWLDGPGGNDGHE